MLEELHKRHKDNEKAVADLKLRIIAHISQREAYDVDKKMSWFEEIDAMCAHSKKNIV